MHRTYKTLLSSIILLFVSFSSHAQLGNLFNVNMTGSMATITPTIPNHLYPQAGILILTPGFTVVNSGIVCTFADNSYCLFPVSSSQPKQFTIAGAVARNLEISLCLNGASAISCQTYIAPFNPMLATLQFLQSGVPISQLSLAPGASGTITLKNIGANPANNISIAIPPIWIAYFNENCPATLAANASCSIDYTIPSPAIAGTNNLVANSTSATNSPLSLPITIQSVGHLEFRQSGVAVTTLNIQQNDSGSFSLLNTGTSSASNVSVSIPSQWSSYFTNNCAGPLTLAPGASCSVTYVTPSPALYGTNNITATATGTDNSPINLATTINPVGGVKCWGINSFGQLGNTTNSGTANANQTPLNVQTMSGGVKQIVTGYAHTCALLTNGSLYCWGYNIYGQLGSTVNSGSGTPNNVPLPVFTLSSGVKQVVAGISHTCALLDSGEVKCWGSNQYGQLGNLINSGTTLANNVPITVTGLATGVATIAAGGTHTCALLNTGDIQCWGLNSYGQLGRTVNNGNNNPNPVPASIRTPIANAGSLHGGYYHTCALVNTTGELRCWGYNYFGQVGVNTGTGTTTPIVDSVVVTNLSSGVIAVALGSYHSCALLNTGAPLCWGYNLYGQTGSTLNSGSGTNPTPTPQNVQTLSSGVSEISTGENTSCALLGNGSMKCWGGNQYGTAGSNTNVNTANPNNSPLNVLTFGSGTVAHLVINGLGLHMCAIIP